MGQWPGEDLSSLCRIPYWTFHYPFHDVPEDSIPQNHGVCHLSMILK